MPRRDYASKQSHNYKAPRKHIRRDKLKKEIIKKRLKFFLYTIVLLGFVFSVNYWFFFSSLLVIDKIEVRGERGEEHQQLSALVYQKLKQKKWHLLPQSNYFLFSADQFAQELKHQDINPPVFEISVQKVWPNKLLLSFKKRIPRLRIITINESEDKETDIKISQHDYLVDDKGFVVDDTPQDLGDEPVVYLDLFGDKNFKGGETILGEGTVNNLIKLYNIFTNTNTGLSVAYFRLIQQEMSAVKVYTDQGYYIYFSFDYPLQKQINHLILSLNKIGEQRNKLEYLDLRIEDRAYACCGLTF